MSSAGLWMLLALGLLTVSTGLPVWALLIGVSTLFASVGVAGAAIDWHVLMAIQARIVGLLENDLLQALPLYVFIGIVLQRLTISDKVFSSLAALGGGSQGARACAALGVGTLIAPMNGSVASSSALLARLIAPRVKAMDAPRAVALVGVAATIGVVVPPSLVLILLGDAMMRAHTEAGNLPGATPGVMRMVNTQDVLNGALVPALLVLVLWLIVAWWQNGCGKTDRKSESAPWSSHILSAMAVATIVALLAGVFRGKLLAVEAAASAACLLVVASVAWQLLDKGQWRAVLADTLSLSGALMALLVGATTFSLVFRAFGTDRLLSDMVLSSGLAPYQGALVILLFVGACAWVLDAFEMIFVIVPVVAPSLINRLGDAQQASVLLLLVLQVSFLVPPMGYAIVMAQARAGLGSTTTAALLRAVSPYIVVQCLVTASVFARPGFVHLLDAPVAAPAPVQAESDQELERRIREMTNPAGKP